MVNRKMCIGKPQEKVAYSYNREVDYLTGAGIKKCTKGPFIEALRCSSESDLNDIAECILLGEAELKIAMSKIKKLFLITDKTKIQKTEIKALRVYQDRIGKALMDLSY